MAVPTPEGTTNVVRTISKPQSKINVLQDDGLNYSRQELTEQGSN